MQRYRVDTASRVHIYEIYTEKDMGFLTTFLLLAALDFVKSKNTGVHSVLWISKSQ